MKRRSQVKTTALAAAAALLLIVALVATQPWSSEDETISLSRAEDLAALNSKELDDYAAGYLERNNNFEELEYVAVQEDKHPVRMMIGNRQDDLKGFLVNDERFAVQLMACDWMDGVCSFRINGVATGAMKPDDAGTSEFLLDSDYKLTLKEVQFDFCDNRRFCNLHFEAYDIVDVEIERR